GGGLYLVSTGKASQQRVMRRFYGAANDEDVTEKYHAVLARIPEAKVVILGVPSDVGAGFRRGANLGPMAIRAQLLDEDPRFAEDMLARGVLDIGDVFVVPQLLHDDMLSDDQKRATRDSIHRELSAEDRASLPVSPLSAAERALDLIFAQNAAVKPFVLGGDHSCAWPVVSALSRARTDRWAIVQPDAHTDLLEQRLGVKYCFATWSFHANDLLGRDGRLVQVGTRASGRDRAHWESTLGVRQFWAAECRARPAETLDAILDHLRGVGATSVYFSNDIDGTDATYADATGTPEPWGLEPDWLLKLIKRLGGEIGIAGGDIMEVAPPLRQIPRGATKTTRLAARYFRETIASALALAAIALYAGCSRHTMESTPTESAPIAAEQNMPPEPSTAPAPPDANGLVDVIDLDGILYAATPEGLYYEKVTIYKNGSPLLRRTRAGDEKLGSSIFGFAITDDAVYWTVPDFESQHAGAVMRAKRPDGKAEELVRGIDLPEKIVVLGDQLVYWEKGALFTVGKNGGTPKPLAGTDANVFDLVAVGDTVYWVGGNTPTDHQIGAVTRAGKTTTVATLDGEAEALATDGKQLFVSYETPTGVTIAALPVGGGPMTKWGEGPFDQHTLVPAGGAVIVMDRDAHVVARIASPGATPEVLYQVPDKMFVTGVVASRGRIVVARDRVLPNPNP
ncbi:MAG TPA: arginase family protein, partial [Kofleriaceae bacterium]|nr:arginase family protein [Kofleriaceae bacterium]